MEQNFVKKLEEYKSDIMEVVSLLHKKFGVYNPISLWRNEKIPKTGFLDNNSRVEFSFHGKGITVSLGEKLISFDFNDDKILLDVFKYKMYLESILDLKIDEDEIRNVLLDKEDVLVNLSEIVPL